jgi:hypothetical protein
LDRLIMLESLVKQIHIRKIAGRGQKVKLYKRTKNEVWIQLAAAIANGIVLMQ